MDAPRWQSAKQLLADVVDLPAVERRAYIETNCTDPTLRRELLAMLESPSSLSNVVAAAVTLTPGTRLGPYEIVELIGAGGMGEVYRARDTTLGRDVAVKVLPATLASDPDRLARLAREARILASLSHPHIGHIYGLEEKDGIRALVLELIDGETLADRLARGPLPVAEALRVAADAAGALAAAHDKGIVHRDLKPSNIKLSSSGVKVLDFGIAKAVESDTHGTTLATAEGTIIGTPAYMSPEQVRGEAVDRQTDVWAFGCVLYEMLTGARAFDGRTSSDLNAAILASDPDLSRLPSAAPSGVRELLERCLRKDKGQRLRDVGDARLEVSDALAKAPGGAHSSRRLLTNPTLFVVASLAVFAAGAAYGVWHVMNRSAVNVRGDGFYASIDVPAGYVLGEADELAPLPIHTPFVFTPDGKALIIQAAQPVAHEDGVPQLFLRSLNQPEAHPIAGTENGRVPFVSPDGKWLGFFAGGGINELRKVPIGGGEPTTICPISDPLGPDGAVWGPDDVILFADDGQGRIMRVSAHGGTPVPVTEKLTETPRTPRLHVTPSFLPDGKTFMFADVSGVNLDDARLEVQNLAGGRPRVLLPGTDGRLLPSGQLVFMRSGALMTVGFDASRATLVGEPVVAMRRVMQTGLRVRAGANNTGAGMFAVSSFGALAVVRGDLAGGEDNRLVWVDRSGHMQPAEPLAGAPSGGRLAPRISPDGARLATSVITVRKWELWIADLRRGTWAQCVDCTNNSTLAKAWSPDGRRLLVPGPGSDSLIVHTVDGSQPDRTILRETGRTLVPAQWLADDGVVYLSDPPEIRFLEAGASVGHRIALGTSPAVSPDRRWLAYISRESGERNIIVQAFPGGGQRQQVSAGGGFGPSWSADGRILYYFRPLANTRTCVLMAVDIPAGAALNPGVPREILRSPLNQECAAVRCYDLAADGRFLFRQPADTKRPSITRIDVVLDWAPPAAGGR